MDISEVRRKYLDFFAAREHTEIPSASLVPENDPTTLFTGSGMQPLLPYLLGESHPEGTRLVDSQKCFRAEDIEEVGDNRHTTFFEMLGNWSLGDYFKEEQLPWCFSFLTDELGIDPKRLYVTVYAGDDTKNLPPDTQSIDIWKKLFEEKGVEAEFAEIGSEKDGYARGMRDKERIFAYDGSKNWWSRVGAPENMPGGEPGGPDSEIFYDFDPSGRMHDPAYGEHCHPNCDCGRFLEICNSVFMEYIRSEDGTFSKLPQQNVDFGGGLERLVAAVNDESDTFKIDSLFAIIETLEKTAKQKYANAEYTRSFRVVADHLRAAVFLIGDGILPGNKDQQYFVRRLLRRAVRHADIIGYTEHTLHKLVPVITGKYQDQYPNLHERSEEIQSAVQEEEQQFRVTLAKGMKQFEKIAITNISGHDAFHLFTTYGFPYEFTEELAAERGLSVDREAFDQEMQQHRAQSRAGAEQKFKGGLADNSIQTTALHTATHLLLAGLRKELGEHVHQQGSNITEKRTRFDFNHDKKVERETLDRVEAYVNNAIQSGARVTVEKMPKEEAKVRGVEGSFWEKYPDTVHVYIIKDDEGNVYSEELCGGPHVTHAAEIEGTFRIIKEESSSAGVRRVKAVLE